LKIERQISRLRKLWTNGNISRRLTSITIFLQHSE
jgi:hypothetical protein